MGEDRAIARSSFGDHAVVFRTSGWFWVAPTLLSRSAMLAWGVAKASRTRQSDMPARYGSAGISRRRRSRPSRSRGGKFENFSRARRQIRSGTLSDALRSHHRRLARHRPRRLSDGRPARLVGRRQLRQRRKGGPVGGRANRRPGRQGGRPQGRRRPRRGSRRDVRSRDERPRTARRRRRQRRRGARRLRGSST